MSLEGKVAIVTGSARGIGRGCAEILLVNKVKVCISDINAVRGRETTETFQAKYGESQVMFFKCDVRDEKQQEELFRQTKATFGRIDIVVNNAGTLWESRFDLLLQVNTAAVYKGTMLSLKYLGTDNGGNGGVIVNVASIAGLLPVDIAPVYSLTKHAVVGFSRAIGRISPKAHGVRVNVLCPTFVDTELIQFDPEDIAAGQMYLPNVDFPARNDRVTMDICGGALVSICETAERFLPLVEDTSLSGQTMVVSPKGSGLATGLAETLDDLLDIAVPHKV